MVCYIRSVGLQFFKIGQAAFCPTRLPVVIILTLLNLVTSCFLLRSPDGWMNRRIRDICQFWSKNATQCAICQLSHLHTDLHLIIRDNLPLPNWCVRRMLMLAKRPTHLSFFIKNSSCDLFRQPHQACREWSINSCFKNYKKVMPSIK